MFSQLKKLRQMRAEADQTVRHIYDGEGREVIDMRVICDDDFLSPYSVGDKPYISGGVAEFLDEAVKPLDLKRGLHIKIKGETIDGDERPIYREAFKNYYCGRVAEVGAKLKRNLVASVVMLLIAVVILSVYVTMEVLGYNYVVLEMVDIVAWVFMWEAVDQFVFERSLLRREYVRDCALYGAVISYE